MAHRRMGNERPRMVIFIPGWPIDRYWALDGRNCPWVSDDGSMDMTCASDVGATPPGWRFATLASKVALRSRTSSC